MCVCVCEREREREREREITLEVGSRGPFDPRGFDRLKAYITAPNKEWDTMLTRTVLLESHKIWTTRNWRDLELPTVD